MDRLMPAPVSRLTHFIQTLFAKVLFVRGGPTPLLSVLSERIAAEGPITIEGFMQTVLHHPTHGYYRAGIPVGREGDFSTGPEESQMFGEMIGVWAHEAWAKMGRPAPFILLELGPGRGTLMQSLLSGMEAAKDFHKALRLYFMESATPLRSMQRGRLLLHNPTYIEKIADLPPLPMIVIGNEFFDTFPMRQFIKRKTGWRERMVALKSGKLAIIEGEPLHSLEGVGTVSAPPADAINGFVYETSPQTQALTKDIALHISQQGGAGLLIDYGYEIPKGEDTLFAFHRHKRTGILYRPGETDVTGDVDFAAQRQILQEAGLSVEPLIGQGAFFLDLGIKERAAMIAENSPLHDDLIAHELYRLTSPAVMGDWFKVLRFAGVPHQKSVG